MSRDFSGDETPTDILNAALADFSVEGAPAIIVHEGNIPYLKIQHDVPTDYVCTYRLDILLLPRFVQAERLCDYYMGVLGTIEHACLVRTTAYIAMSYLLNVLVVNHPGMFLETLDETEFLTETIFLQSVTKRLKTDAAARTLSTSVRDALETLLEKIARRKRESLSDLLNRFPLITIPIGVGRPKGSTKSEEKKAKEKAEFESRIEQVVKSLFHTLAREPYKYEVAEALGIGGFGIDSRINSFNNKLTRLGIDYTAIIERCKPHE